ncbi:MAG: aminomethyltransferase family protein [Clostridia bacterium]|nr:aminomethyltransferase family protein [Clostridia bacterium]
MINLAKQYISGAASTEIIGGREVAAVYTDLATEYRALREESGFIDCADYSVVRVSGDGAAEYLDSLCTKDIQFLNIDMLAECLMLDNDGRSLGVVWVLNAGDDYVVYITPESADGILAWMRENLPNEGVSLTDIEDQVLLGLEGHYTWRIVRDVLDVDVNGMPLRGIQEVTDFAGGKILLARIGRTGEYGYLAMGDPETIKRYADACFQYAEKEGLGLRFVGRSAVDLCMLETGQPNYRYENAEAGNVFELGQQWLIQYEKEMYLGHDALMDCFAAGQNRAAVLFECAASGNVADGDSIWLEDEDAGTVVHAAKNPVTGKMAGIALLRRDLAVSGIDLTAGADKAVITTVSSPVVRPKSWDVRIEE